MRTIITHGGIALRRFAAAMAFAIAGQSLFAAPLDKAYLRGRSDKDQYAAGEKITFTLWLQGAESFSSSEGFSVKWKLFDDNGGTTEGSQEITSASDTVTVEHPGLSIPGFVRLDANVVTNNDWNCKVRAVNLWGENNGMDVVFNGGAGVEMGKMRQEVAEPADFDAYWKGEKARLAAVPFMGLVATNDVTASTGRSDVKVYEIMIPCAARHTQPASARIPDVARVTGFLTVPVDSSKKYPAYVEFQGYGVHVASTPTWYGSDRITFLVNAHATDLNSQVENYYSDLQWNRLMSTDSRGRTWEYGANPEENANPDTSYFNGMALRVVRAFDYVKTLPEWDGVTLVSTGGSQGAFQATWGAALVPEVTELSSFINWNCDIGSHTTTSKRVQPTWQIPWAEGLGYYDECNMARRITGRKVVDITRAGLGDELCPPAGLAAFYNALPCKKSIRWVQGSTHGYEPPAEGRQEFALSVERETTHYFKSK